MKPRGRGRAALAIEGGAGSLSHFALIPGPGKVIASNSVWDGATLTPRYRKPFDVLAEGLHLTSGGADGVLSQTVQRLTQTLESLPETALGGLQAELMAA